MAIIYSDSCVVDLSAETDIKVKKVIIADCHNFRPVLTANCWHLSDSNYYNHAVFLHSRVPSRTFL